MKRETAKQLLSEFSSVLIRHGYKCVIDDDMHGVEVTDGIGTVHWIDVMRLQNRPHKWANEFTPSELELMVSVFLSEDQCKKYLRGE
jgi:hypothetical protein